LRQAHAPGEQQQLCSSSSSNSSRCHTLQITAEWRRCRPMCRFVRLSLSRCTSNHRRYLTCSPTPRTCLYYTHVRRTAYCADLQSILAAAPRTVHITLQSLTLLRRSRSKDLRRKRCHDILSPCGRAVCVGSCRLSAEPRNNHLRFYSSWKTQP